MDRVVIGTAANVEAEYAVGTYVKGDAFVLAHFYNDEPVSVDGFKTKEQAIRALQEYDGCEVERLFTTLD